MSNTPSEKADYQDTDSQSVEPKQESAGDKKPPKKSQIILRRATTCDAIKIFHVIREAFEATKLDYPGIDEDAAVKWIIDVLSNHGVVFLAEKNGRLVGTLGLQPMQFPWVDPSKPESWYLANAWFFVQPRFRKNGTADHLIKKAQEYADKNGAFLSVGMFLERGAALKDRFLKIQGFTYTGGSFIYKG
jgi:predicted N-acetyltransferase YhbS